MAEEQQAQMVFPHSPFVPYDPIVQFYETAAWNFGGDAEAWEYTGWRDETMAWKKAAYIHGHLNPSPTLRITGPDALEFLSGVCVNSFRNFQVVASRHAIMTDEAGRVTSHRMLLRLAEDDFISYWLAPCLSFALARRPELDIVAEDLTGQVFLFQIAGPKSREILEAATLENLHDIKFLRHRMTSVAVLAAGEDYGLRRLGVQAYMCNHPEGGFPQGYYHFPFPGERTTNCSSTSPTSDSRPSGSS
ncbi:hypothetical protein ACQP1W_27670 [Spirillospora sp. CA-255316]